MTLFPVEELFKDHAESLELEWLAGCEGHKQTIVLDTDKQLGNIGYLNLIHPHQIQVIGLYELDYLNTLEKPTYQDALHQLFRNKNLACLIIVDHQMVPKELREQADHYRIPLLRTRFPGETVITTLHATLSRLLAERITLHGVFMDVLGIGVLITGDSGTGKSELALELVSRGHRLIADDAPEFRKITPNTINGTCPLGMTPFLEVRGLGILNVQALFGDSAVKKDKYLRLVVHLEPMSPEKLRTIDRLQGDYGIRRVLGIEIPEIRLPVAPGRNLAVLLECAVRNHNLKMQGYNAAEDFCERQQSAMQALNPTQNEEWSKTH